MHLTSGEIALAVTATTVTLGMLAAFFVLIALRQYRLNVQRQVRLLNAVAEAQDAERKRIAEDMHDGLGQLLAASKLQTDSLRNADPNVLPERIKVIKQTLDQASAEVRAVINDLVPRGLERDGLHVALNELAKSIASSEQFHIDITFSGEQRRFAPRAELNIYRIVQELVTNAVKHANADKVNVSVTTSPDALRIVVTDNGSGFDPENSAGGGNGLRNIRNRTEWLKGTMQFRNAEPSGTTAEIAFNTKHLDDRA